MNKMALNKDGVLLPGNNTQTSTINRQQEPDINTLIFDSLCEIKELLADIRDVQLPKVRLELERLAIEGEEHTLKLVSMTTTINRINEIVHNKVKNVTK